MKTIELTVYTASELKSQFPKAFDKAREKYNDTVDVEWWDDCYEDLLNIAPLMGFSIERKNIQFSGFWSQGDGASFTGSAIFAADALEKVKTECPIDTELHRIAAECAEYGKAGIRCNIIRTSSHYCHENTVTVDATSSATESDVENGYAAEVGDDCEVEPETGKSVTETCRSLMRWHYRQLEKECGYLSGEECFLETADANDWHFDEYGDLVN